MDAPERTSRAVRALATCWGLAVLAVFLPVLHFVLVPSLLVAGPVVALSRLRERCTVRGASGTCPACGAAQSFAVSGALRVAPPCAVTRAGARYRFARPSPRHWSSSKRYMRRRLRRSSAFACRRPCEGVCGPDGVEGRDEDSERPPREPPDVRRTIPARARGSACPVPARPDGGRSRSRESSRAGSSVRGSARYLRRRGARRGS